jgi:hypothetical protein
MFRFADLDRVLQPVEIGGGTLRVLYRILSRAELRAREREATMTVGRKLGEDGAPRSADEVEALLDAAAARESGNEALLRERVVGWYDLEGPDGEPLEFTRERLDALLATDYGYRALLGGLMRASRDGPGKNSSPGPAGMPARDQA